MLGAFASASRIADVLEPEKVRRSEKRLPAGDQPKYRKESDQGRLHATHHLFDNALRRTFM
jgi:hypothetical protein